jgi:hypothetical protein
MALSNAYTLAAFDPGERTGFVVVRVAPDFHPFRAPAHDTFSIDNQGVLTVREVGHRLAGIIRTVDRVTYETWRLYGSHANSMIGNDMQPSQVVGMIRYEAWKQQRPISSHGADVKTAALKTMPEWLVAHMALSSEQHDKDAIMHAWFEAVRIWHTTR